MRTLLVTTLFVPLLFCFLYAQKSTDYAVYHKTVLSVEELIVEEDYNKALDQMEYLSAAYDFVFLKEYKIATQLAIYIKDFDRAFKFLKLGVSNGWTLKEMRKNNFLKPLTAMEEWSSIVADYAVLRTEYEKRIDDDLRNEVYAMYKKDQKFAIKHLLKIGQKAKERHGSEKGEPHTRQQIAKLKAMLKSKGYPSEKNIGESQWMTIILAHHNSLSKAFVVNDTLYPTLRPELLKAISNGEMSPYDFAFIEDWKIAVGSDRQDSGYGYLDVPTQEELPKTNALRRKLNMRSIATRNGLVVIQEKTGMNFYLAGAPWVEGKIVVRNE
ncbi:hypothetical protein N9954_08060 [Maribacter sp.]|nr:hypothetical protein [Maribacter sp.]